MSDSIYNEKGANGSAIMVTKTQKVTLIADEKILSKVLFPRRYVLSIKEIDLLTTLNFNLKY